MRKIIAAAVVAGVVATPSAVLAHGPSASKGAEPAKKVAPAKVKKDERGHKGKRAKRNPFVNMVFSGIVSADASAEAVELTSVDGINRFAERALGASDTMTLKLRAATKLKGTVIMADGTKRTALETVADLKAGDRVFFVVRARKGTSAADLPAARWLRDLTGTVTPAPASDPAAPTDAAPTDAAV